MGRKLGICRGFLEGGDKLGPHLTQSPGPRPTSISSGILIHPAVCMATTDIGQKLGCVPLLGRSLHGSPSNTMSRVPRHTSVPNGTLMHSAIWWQYIWAENWGGCVPLFGGDESPSNIMRPQPRPTTMPSFILIHPTVPESSEVLAMLLKDIVYLVSIK